jgi:NitT/TauT family transport system ATP-binding protein
VDGRPEVVLNPASPATAPKMRLEHVTRTFLDGAVIAFQDLVLDVLPNEALCVVGPSGCGKTTLLRVLAGLIAPSEGRVYLDERPITAPDPSVVMVFQHFGLFPWKTVFDNVAYGLKLRGVPRGEWRKLAQPYIDLVGLAGFEAMYPYQLSGGMQQRAGLARALVLNPQVLLMDEPFGALDAQTRELLQEELVRILEQERRTLVFITHSIDEAIVLGDRIVVMSTRPGRIREVLEVGLPRPRSVQDARTSARYAELRQHIWEELRPEVSLARAG